MRRWRAAALALGLALAGLAASAAPAVAAVPAPPRWQPWVQGNVAVLGEAQGLPNPVTTAVAEDRNGLLWVGTMGGLVRWDGYSFSRPTGAGESALGDGAVQVLHRDSRGGLWVGRSAGGLVRLAQGAQPARAYPAGPQGLIHEGVRALADDGRGGLWVGTEAGLDHLEPDSGRVTRVPMDGSNGLRGSEALGLLRDRTGRLWVGTMRGLFVRDTETGPFREVPLPLPDGRPAAAEGALVGPLPESLMEDSAGRLWIGTSRHGVYRLDPGPGAVPVAVTRGDVRAATARVAGLVEVRPGEVWAATLGQGVLQIDAVSGTVRRLAHRTSGASGLPDNHVAGLYRDRAGLIWAATYSGLARLNPLADAVLNVAPPRRGEDSDNGRMDFLSVLAHSSGEVWLGTLVQGVEILNPATGQRRSLQPDGSRPATALPPDNTVALAEAPDGSVYASTSRGLYRLRSAGTAAPQVERIGWAGRPADSGSGPLLRDGKTLWVGGLRDGLWQLDLDTGEARCAICDPTEALTDRRLMAMARGHDGALWLGTRNGLNRYDPQTGAVQRILPEPGGLGGGFVSALLVDGEQRLWVATYGHGLYRLRSGGNGREPARFERWGRAQGLPDENVNALVLDTGGQVWASTDTGLAVIHPGSRRARALTRGDGVEPGAFWTNAAARTAAGELVFGASGAIAVVRPERLQPWRHRPAVVITQLAADGQPLVVPEPGALLTLPPRLRRLEVTYAALDYSAPAQNLYAWRLVGQDDDWTTHDAGHRHLTFPQLAPGDYRLDLRGSNREGVFTDTTTTLLLRVQPAWHQTLGFQLLLLLAAAAAVWGTIQLRTRLLRRRRVELERLVDQRTEELQALSRALTAQTRRLEEQSVRDPLTGLHNRRHLTQQIDRLLQAVDRGNSDALFLLVDIDHFKRINDVHGHAAGDAVLVRLAERLRSHLPTDALLVRWGGEEFLAVLPGMRREDADARAEALRSALAREALVLPDGRALGLSASIGHACWPFVPHQPLSLDWEGVVGMADLALLAAKRAGRDGWVGLQATADTPTDGRLAGLLHRAPNTLLQDAGLQVTASRGAEAVAQAWSTGRR